MRLPVFPRLTHFALLLGLAIALAGQAEPLPKGKPDREGLSSDRLARLSAFMNGEVDKGTMIGGLGMIARNGKVVYLDTYGLADRETNRPMTQDTIFRIYSMTKPITAVALMMLYEEGKFFLNDPVARYLPELADLKVQVSTADGSTQIISDGTQSRTVGESVQGVEGQTREPARQPTIRDLLTHTSGMTYGIFGDTEVDRQYRDSGLWEQSTIEDFVKVLGTLPLQYEPGSQWHYSVSVDVQGRLVEVLSGMPFGEFLEQRLFQPLGMEDTGFTLPEAKWSRMAQIYAPEGSAANWTAAWQPSGSKTLVVADDRINDNYRPGATFQGGGGGLVSTASDYMRFCLMLLGGGELDGVRVLSPKTVAFMTSNHIGELNLSRGRQGVGFGLGFMVVQDPGQLGEIASVGEYSWGGAAGTRFWIDPQEELVGIFMTQSIPHETQLREQFRVLTYQSIEESYADEN